MHELENTLEEYKKSSSKETFIFNIVIAGLSAISRNEAPREDLTNFLLGVKDLGDEQYVKNVMFVIGENVINKYNLLW